MNETHERLWHEWYGLWHGADASKPKPGYEEWLEARIEELEVAAQQVAEADRAGRIEAALRWMVNVANDVGKSGGKPYPDEWKDATDEGMAALGPAA